jgi:hypothetical protein
MDRVSGGGMALVDIDRSPLALGAARILPSILVPSSRPWLAHDGVTSVRRAYTRPELSLILDCAGVISRYHVYRLPVIHPGRLIINAIYPSGGKIGSGSIRRSLLVGGIVH